MIPTPKSVNGSFARRTGMIAVGQASVKLTQLVVAVVLVRLLSPTEWNETAFLLTIYIAAITVGTLNMHQGIVFFMPRVSATERRALAGQVVGLLAVIGIAIAIGLTIAAPALSGGRLGDPDRLPWLGLAIALELPAACSGIVLIATERFGGAAVWDLIGTGLVIVCTALPVAVGAGVDGVVAGLVVVGAVRLSATIGVVVAVLPGRWWGTLPRGMFTRQIRYGLPLGITLTVSILNRLVDKWYIAGFRSGDFGVYAIAAQEVPLLAVLPYAGGAALVTALVAAFHEGDRALARAHWIHLTITMSAVVVPMAIVVILLAPELMTWIFTADFAAGVLSFQIFTLITVHRVAEYGMILRAAGRNTDLLRVAGLTLGSNVVLAGIGAATGGMVGASIGTLIASTIGWLYALSRIADALDVGIGEAFAWRAWSSSVAIAGVAGGLAWAIGDGFDTALVRGLTKFMVFAVVYVAGRWWWRRSPWSTVPSAVIAPAERRLDLVPSEVRSAA